MAAAESAPLRVLLVGNYAPDQQESMQRFAQALAEHLPAQGITPRLIRPEPRAGRLCPGDHGLGKWLGYIDKFLVFPNALQATVQAMLRQPGPLVVHICDHSNAMYVNLLQRVPHLVTCNDLLAIRSARREFAAHRTRWSGRVLQWLILRGLRRARRITCISHATERDARRLLSYSSAQISVTHMGLNHPYVPLPREQARERVASLLGANSAPPFLLHVGGEQWYKNRAGVLAIYATLRRRLLAAGKPSPRLVLVGPPLAGEYAATLRAEPGLAADVQVLGGLDNESLRACYSAAELLLFPSLEEGFGWPIVEAQACGCRVVTTGQPPMDEVGGEGPAYLAPGTLSAPEACAAVVEAMLAESENERSRRIELGLANARRFATEKMAAGYAEIYRELAATPR
jgi:glycosyltransferase involved in cell wall biosynthesis